METLDVFDGGVLAAVIDEDDLPLVLGVGIHEGFEPLVHRGQNLFLVVAGNYDRNFILLRLWHNLDVLLHCCKGSNYSMNDNG